ncbi:ABC transporter substrate-binding protein [Paenibacillus lutrae]|uniref:ABC transporter substrate-binding protein n=1 Tax=Paenibacillus lutrae TaxID=2078573 RepID=A0A7X3JYI4_9BACL|nr:ABC transporter substrate-binding protein [Paenibacillus lutrae]MVO98955.1 ABC transporter substrate-binding protein [Paenibacillus lutrae]
MRNPQESKQSKRYLQLILVFMLALLLTACGKNEQPPAGTAAPSSSSPAPQTADSKKTQYPLKVKDATGKEFTFDKAPQKIISVSPAETEALFAIGLGDKIVGVSDYDDYPAEAKSKPKMGGIVQPNQESIIASGAEIVFTGVSMKSESVEKLRAMNINVFKVEPKTVDDVIQNVLLYGKITDHQEQAEKVVSKMKEELKKVTDAVKTVAADQKKKVYIEFSPGWTVGKGEFMDELISLSGGVNAASDITGWKQISEEKIIQANPDVILFANDVVDDKTKKSLEQLIRERSGWGEIKAVKDNRVIGLDQNKLSRPGPRLTEGLLEMAKAIYPDLVK